MSHEMTVRNGTVVTGGGPIRADIGIDGGRIAAVAARLTPGTTDIDASGLVVVPGAIDPHTHFAIYSARSRTRSVDDYEAGTRAALLGGVTTVLNCAFQRPGEDLDTAIGRELELARMAHIDYGFHVAVTDLDVPDSLGQIRRLRSRGQASIKVFTSLAPYLLPKRDLLRVLEVAAETGLIVNVHVEDDALCTHLTSRSLESGRSSVAHYASARPAVAEALAVEEIGVYARAAGASVYFIYLSSEAGVRAALRARRAGTRAFIETRPLYLFLDDTRYSLPVTEAQRYVCLPPLRTPADQEALWHGLRSGDIDTYATDHVAWTAAQKGREELPFPEVPAGVSNVQTSVGMLFAEGVRKGRISLSRFVELTATNPARIFGLWPRKGTIAVGSDADIVLIDPARRFTVRSDVLASRADFDLFEGQEFVGWPVVTVSGGEVVASDGQLLSSPGRGRFLQATQQGAAV
ncbi:amidohydrolase family protein [Amycolatopsis pithecellobii]|uniref:amidohydrolase family protein n=1 Tax=Amycolatopsis pithecellobii TaxID=664692 RepID=UPI00140C7A31|nr:amidohydrolase family protein [Amycolatopsis pithecellobii]